MAHYVTCRLCREKFNRDKYEFIVEGSKKFYHKECYEKYSESKEKCEDTPIKSKGNFKVCFYCKKKFDIDKESYRKPRTNRYAHEKCYNDNFVPDEDFEPQIWNFLKEFGVPFDYNKSNKQRIFYISKNGYTNEGILNALKYHYIINKGDITKSGKGIGIVPYVYDDAQDYYHQLEMNQQNLIDAYLSQKKKGVLKIQVSAPEKERKKRYIDLDSIGEGEDEFG